MEPDSSDFSPDRQNSNNFMLDDYLGIKKNQLGAHISYKKKVAKKVESDLSPTDIVKTISPYWLNIDTLKAEYKHNQTYVSNIENLYNKYCAWKRVRGDGNCYYRSVISTYFLKIFHFNQNNNRIYELCLILREIEKRSDFPYEYICSIRRVSQESSSLYQLKKGLMKDRITAFEQVNKLLQDAEFDLDLVRVSRAISYDTLNSEKGDEIRPFMDEGELDQINNNIMSMGTEAEGVELLLCPLALKILVTQINIFDTLLESTFPGDKQELADSDGYLVINIICKSRGHYDALYSIKDMEEDDYCIDDASYQYDEDWEVSNDYYQ